MTVAVEREVKFVVPSDFTMPDLTSVTAGVSAGPAVQYELDAIYVDTADLALARAGVTLRYRTGEDEPGWTLKLPSRADGSMLTRTELTFAGEDDAVPADARDLVRAYVRKRRLRRVAYLRTARTCVPLVDGTGRLLAELVDDHVQVLERRRRTGAFREVELELKSNSGRLRRSVVKRLVAAGCLDGPAVPKLVRALGEPAGAPPDVVIPEIGAKPTVADLIGHALATNVDRLISHDPGVRLGSDPEDLHKFRVAARTLRSDLKTFASVLDRGWCDALRGELGWLGTAVGQQRDLDVLGDRLRGLVADLPVDDAPGAAALIERIQAQRDAAHDALLTALRSRRYDALLEALVEAARAPVFDATDPVPARRFVRDSARAQYRRLRRAVGALPEAPSDVALHRIRILAKRSRYAMDAARPVIGLPAEQHADAVADLQTVLGDLHDAVVAVEWLREAAASDPRCALVAGQLIAAERARGVRLRGEWREVWRAANTTGLRAWL